MPEHLGCFLISRVDAVRTRLYSGRRSLAELRTAMGYLVRFRAVRLADCLGPIASWEPEWVSGEARFFVV